MHLMRERSVQRLGDPSAEAPAVFRVRWIRFQGAMSKGDRQY